MVCDSRGVSLGPECEVIGHEFGGEWPPRTGERKVGHLGQAEALAMRPPSASLTSTPASTVAPPPHPAVALPAPAPPADGARMPRAGDGSLGASTFGASSKGGRRLDPVSTSSINPSGTLKGGGTRVQSTAPKKRISAAEMDANWDAMECDVSHGRPEAAQRASNGWRVIG